MFAFVPTEVDGGAVVICVNDTVPKGIKQRGKEVRRK